MSAEPPSRPGLPWTSMEVLPRVVVVGGACGSGRTPARELRIKRWGFESVRATQAAKSQPPRGPPRVRVGRGSEGEQLGRLPQFDLRTSPVRRLLALTSLAGFVLADDCGRHTSASRSRRAPTECVWPGTSRTGTPSSLRLRRGTQRSGPAILAAEGEARRAAQRPRPGTATLHGSATVSQPLSSQAV
jgi:hypothetical protein